jgi:hypothetical protein
MRHGVAGYFRSKLAMADHETLSFKPLKDQGHFKSQRRPSSV